MVLDEFQKIRWFALRTLLSRLELEMGGLKGRGPTAYATIKRTYGLSGSREADHRQYKLMVEDSLPAKCQAPPFHKKWLGQGASPQSCTLFFVVNDSAPGL